jgi:hypothetical protein
MERGVIYELTKGQQSSPNVMRNNLRGRIVRLFP